MLLEQGAEATRKAYWAVSLRSEQTMQHFHQVSSDTRLFAFLLIASCAIQDQGTVLSRQRAGGASWLGRCGQSAERASEKEG